VCGACSGVAEVCECGGRVCGACSGVAEGCEWEGRVFRCVVARLRCGSGRGGCSGVYWRGQEVCE